MKVAKIRILKPMYKLLLKRSWALAIALFAITLAVSGYKLRLASAACPPTSTNYGSVTSQINIASSGTYRVWSRIMAPDATNNSYTLSIDSSTCNVVVGDKAIAANTWTWVNYRDGNTASTVDISLNAGSHTVTMVGTEPSVKLDRLIFTTDLTCVPTGTGDNCANPPDTDPPVVSITSPADGSTAQPTTTVNVNATDASGIKQVDLAVLRKGDNKVMSTQTDTTPAYSFQVDTTGLAYGDYYLWASATDNSSNHNQGFSTLVTIHVPDTTKPTVSITSPVNNSTVSGTTVMSATAADETNGSGLKQVDYYIDAANTQNPTGTPIATDTTTPFNDSLDTTSLSNAVHHLTAKATDNAGNFSTSTVAFTVNNGGGGDTTPPTVSLSNPSSNDSISGTYTLKAAAADPESGVDRVEFYYCKTTCAADKSNATQANIDTTAPYQFALDTTKLSNGKYEFYAIAYNKATPTKLSTTSTSATNVTVSNVIYDDNDINESGCVNGLDLSVMKSALQLVPPVVTVGDRRNVDKDPNGNVNGLDLSHMKSSLERDSSGACQDGPAHWHP